MPKQDNSVREYLQSNKFPKENYTVQEVSNYEESLRKPSKEVDVELITTDKFQEFLAKLKEAMLKVKIQKGWIHAGVSAVQVGEHISVFYAYDGLHDTYNVYINPEVEFLGTASDVKDEACLSIPGIVKPVRRFKRIRVKYYNEEGKRMREKLSGWNARVVQHEYDHTLGILFTDITEE